ncbi:hypothetical protein ACFFRR_006272 [Megaselia abdita]
MVQHLFELIDDIWFDGILKYLSLEDLTTFSLTSKNAFRLTEEAIIKKTALSFESSLSLSEKAEIENFQRNYQRVKFAEDTVLSTGYEIEILKYLKELKFNINHISLEFKNTEDLDVIKGLFPTLSSLQLTLQYGNYSESFQDDYVIFGKLLPVFVTCFKIAVQEEHFLYILAQFPNLVELEIDVLTTTPEKNKKKMKGSFRIPQVKSLTVSTEALDELLIFNNLEKLSLNNISNISFIKTLITQNAKTLKTVEISECLLDEDFEIPSQLKTLKIFVNECNFENLFKNQNKLEVVELSMCQISQNVLDSLVKNNNLKTLCFEHSHFDEDISENSDFSKLLSNLKSFQYSENQQQPTKFLEIVYKNLRNVERLNLGLTDVTLEKVEQLEKLKSLHLEFFEIAEVANSVFFKSENLHELTFENFSPKIVLNFPNTRVLKIRSDLFEFNDAKIVLEHLKLLENLHFFLNDENCFGDTMKTIFEEGNGQCLKFLTVYIQSPFGKIIEFIKEFFKSYVIDEDIARKSFVVVEIDMRTREEPFVKVYHSYKAVYGI